jgi:hypothetical protein
VIDLVLLRRGSTAWGLAHDAVTGFSPRAGAIAITVPGATILADRVLGVARQVRVRPAGQILRHFWGHPCLGTALVEGLPLVVVDPTAPPEELLGNEGDSDEH